MISVMFTYGTAAAFVPPPGIALARLRPDQSQAAPAADGYRPLLKTKPIARRFAAMRGALAFAFALGSTSVLANDDGTDPELAKVIGALDQQVFDAYNRCDLETFSRFFAPDVEFYHDKGGVTWDRNSVVENTRKWICGKVRRELLPETLRIYPIAGFGAVEEGEHRFCQVATGECEGIAKFIMIWRKRGETWEMTRVISYGHRPNPTG